MSSDKVKNTRAELDQVTVIMKENLEKVIERDNNITDVLLSSEDLEYSAGTFKKNTTKLKNKMWWKNATMGICAGLTCLIVIIVIAVIIKKNT